jgi:hypothetical protein
MHLNAPELLQPVFDFLDGVIRDYGDIFFMLFVYAAIPFLVWVLCGGLRRKFLAGKHLPAALPVIVVHIPVGMPAPPPEPLPPLVGYDPESLWYDHDGDCHAD